MEIQIKDFDECKHRALRIAAAPESAGDGPGMTIAWLTIISSPLFAVSMVAHFVYEH